MKLIDKLLSKFTNRRKIEEKFNDPVNELFQSSLKEEYISLGSWNTYSYFDSEKFENKISDNQESDYTIIGLEKKELKTLKNLCGTIETHISYWGNSLSPQVSVDLEIMKDSKNILKLINHMREQING